MKFLKIQNDGVLDIRLVALMGGTTKANDAFKIGQFGSGLKYTLAFLLRNNIAFHIFAGDEAVAIETVVENIREEDFEILCINGNRTSITTRMGLEWEAWMIVRELWCNALDEGNPVREETTLVEGKAGTTTFYIQIDAQIRQVLDRWDSFFLHNKVPLFTIGTRSIYAGGESLRLYKKGVLIHEDKTKKSLFAYDLATATINEMREFKGSPSMEIANTLCNADERTAAYFLENIRDDHFEGDMDYAWYTPDWSAGWKQAIGSAKLIYPKAIERIQARGGEIDANDYVVVPECIFKALTTQFEGIGGLRVSGKVHEFHEHFDLICEQRVKEGLVILEACNYNMHPDLTFRYGFFGDKRNLAKVSMDDKIVYLSNTLVQRPLSDVVSTLIEENEHFNTGHSDCTREFQQHFIDLYARALLSQNAIEV